MSAPADTRSKRAGWDETSYLLDLQAHHQQRKHSPTFADRWRTPAERVQREHTAAAQAAAAAAQAAAGAAQQGPHIEKRAHRYANYCRQAAAAMEPPAEQEPAPPMQQQRDDSGRVAEAEDEGVVEDQEEPDVRVSTDAAADLHSALTAFYKQVEPAKIAKVDGILAKHSGHEPLLSNLRAKYGGRPDASPALAQLAEAWWKAGLQQRLARRIGSWYKPTAEQMPFVLATLVAENEELKASQRRMLEQTAGVAAALGALTKVVERMDGRLEAIEGRMAAAQQKACAEGKARKAAKAVLTSHLVAGLLAAQGAGEESRGLAPASAHVPCDGGGD